MLKESWNLDAALQNNVIFKCMILPYADFYKFVKANPGIFWQRKSVFF